MPSAAITDQIRGLVRGNFVMAALPKRFGYSEERSVVAVLESYLIVEDSHKGDNKIIFTVKAPNHGTFTTWYCRPLQEQEYEYMTLAMEGDTAGVREKLGRHFRPYEVLMWTKHNMNLLFGIYNDVAAVKD